MLLFFSNTYMYYNLNLMITQKLKKNTLCIIKMLKYECSFKNDKNPLLCAFSISVFLHELGNMFVMCNVFLKWQIF